MDGYYIEIVATNVAKWEILYFCNLQIIFFSFSTVVVL